MSKQSLFKTKTMIGIYVMLLSTFVLVSPKIEAMVKRNATDVDRANYLDLLSIVVSFAGAGIATIGRYQAGGVYTPRGLPGIDPPDPLQ